MSGLHFAKNIDGVTVRVGINQLAVSRAHQNQICVAVAVFDGLAGVVARTSATWGF